MGRTMKGWKPVQVKKARGVRKTGRGQKKGWALIEGGPASFPRSNRNALPNSLTIMVTSSGSTGNGSLFKRMVTNRKFQGFACGLLNRCQRRS